MQPLADLRIIAVEQFGAGPFGSVHLADLGADVIKIEDPRAGGDVGRTVPPFVENDTSLFFETFNRNKRSISLNISAPPGRAVFEDLVRHSDAVFSNLRGDVPGRLKIMYNDLTHINPKIVCCSVSGFGMDGPRQKDPGYDYILQGLAGWMSLTGEPGGPPTKTGLSLVDFSGGFVGALAMLAGIHQARRDGVGMDCDVSLYDTAMSLLTYPATWYLTKGHVTSRTARSSHPSMVPFGNYPTRDGWIVLSCAKEKFWERLCDAIGRPDLPKDARFVDFAARRENVVACNAELDAALRTRTTAEWMDVLPEAGVPCGPILELPQAFEDPHCDARSMVIEMDHPDFGTVRTVNSPVRVGPPRTQHRRAPQPNEDADHILRHLLGYDAVKVDQLDAAGAFGNRPS